MTRNNTLENQSCPHCAQVVTPGFNSRERMQILWLALSFSLLLLGILFEKQLDATPARLGSRILFLGLWLISGRQVLRSALYNLLRGRVMDENFLMSLATVGAILVDALPEAAGVMVFYTIGEFLQERAVRSSRKQIAALLDIRPEYATILRDSDGSGDSDGVGDNDGIGAGVGIRVAPGDVPPGSRIAILPGERIPLDGVILSGSTSLDTSALTGESLPRTVGPGDEVAAGAVSLSGSLVVKTTRVYGESAVARILDLVENATARKAKTERFFSTFARWYTPAVTGLAAATAILPPLLVPGERLADWGYRALVMLVISCPCALVVSIPLAYFGGIGAASRRGILIKGSDYLDALAKVGTVVLDKTGTITTGRFELTQVLPAPGVGRGELLALAAAAEAGSTHPLAGAVKRGFESVVFGSSTLGIMSSEIPDSLGRLPAAGEGEWKDLGGFGFEVFIEGTSIIAGSSRLMRQRGVRGYTDTQEESGEGALIHVATDGQYSGMLVANDLIKEDSARAIRQMRSLGVRRIAMLTGDRESVAKSVAEQAGVDEHFSGLLPGDKVDYFDRIAGTGSGERKPGDARVREKTVFVGDGINDAPVLARADIGISMGGLGSQAAIESSDVVIVNDSLSRIPEAIGIARSTRRILFQNIVFALSVKFIFITLGAAGLASMWEAVFGDVGVALLAVLNSTRTMSSGKGKT